MSNIAWSGELRLLESKWTDKDGHTVSFQLVNPNDTRPNPFSKFTKRRKGMAGTRFHMTLAKIVEEDHPVGLAYDDDAMLAGWGHTSTQGYTVRFWVLPPADFMVHRLEEYSRGACFMAVFVELDDDETPIDQRLRDNVEGDAHTQQSIDYPEKRSRGQYASNAAHMLATNPIFWRWLNQTMNSNVNSQEGATMVIKQTLDINSRKELDSDPGKETMFHERIRKPFVEWSSEQQTA